MWVWFQTVRSLGVVSHAVALIHMRERGSCLVQLVRMSVAGLVDGTIDQTGAGTTALLALIAWQIRLSLTHAASQCLPHQAFLWPLRRSGRTNKSG